MSTVPRVDELVEVLLIEDSHADAEFILWALQERGLGRNVKVVQDGQAALDYLFRLGPYRNIRRSQLPRLVILEHRIPKRSCLDVLQAMKTDPDLKTVPVVVLSASEDEQDRDACLAAGANSFVFKPVSPDKFGDIIGQVAIYWMLVHAAHGYLPVPPPSPLDHSAGLPADALSPPVDGQPLLRVLIVERAMAEGAPVRTELERGGFHLEADLVSSRKQLAARLDQNSYDVVIAADALSGWTGLDALQALRRSGHDTPFILVTDLISDAEALQYLKEGASDYLYRDRLSRLPVAVRRALHDRAMAHKKKAAQDRLRSQERRQAVVALLGKAALGGADHLALRNQAVRLTGKALGVPLAGYFELEDGGDSAILRSGKGWRKGVVGQTRIDVAAGTPFARALEERETVRLAPADVVDPMLADHGVRCGLWTPVAGGNEKGAAGFLGFFSTHDQKFDRDQSHFVESVAQLLTEAAVRSDTTNALRLLESAVEASTEAVIVTTADLDSPGPHIVYVNPAFTTMTGYDREGVLGQSPRFLQGKHTQRDTLRRLKEQLVQGQPFSGEIINYRKNGTEYLAETDIAPIRDDHGQVTHFVAVQRDVTDSRQSKERLRQSQKIEAVVQLAGGVAHDFNNLLMAITGYTALLLDRVPADSPLRADLEEVDRVAQRGASLTHQLLAFSRRQVLQPKIVDLNEIIGDMERMLRRIIGENIDLVTMTDDTLGRTKADPGQLQQVLLNLAANARDAMPNGGRLLIESSNTTVDAEYAERHPPLVPGEYVQLTVSDNGIGMADEVKDRLFEPFFTTKRRGAGTGLGLATVYGIVKQSGGYIYVNSAPRRGSSFIIYLPRVDEVPKEIAPAPIQTPKPGMETLLVVEDEDTVRTLVTRILRERGYTVLVAPDGEEGLRLALDWDGPIDLVVTDVVMPSLSGPDMVSRLAERRREFPVVFMSGYTELALSPVNVLPDDTAFLQKPFTPDALLGKIREVLDRRQSEPPAEHEPTGGIASV